APEGRPRRTPIRSSWTPTKKKRKRTTRSMTTTMMSSCRSGSAHSRSTARYSPPTHSRRAQRTPERRRARAWCEPIRGRRLSEAARHDEAREGRRGHHHARRRAPRALRGEQEVDGHSRERDASGDEAEERRGPERVAG